jgi:hypothetical protein
LVDRRQLDVAQRYQQPVQPGLGVFSARLRLEIARDGRGEGSSTTTFSVPIGAEDFRLEGRGLLLGELLAVALSASLYSLPRDCP